MEGYKPPQEDESKKKGGHALGYAAALAAGALGAVGADKAADHFSGAPTHSVEAPAVNPEYQRHNRLSFENKKAIAAFLVDPSRGLKLNLSHEEVGELDGIGTTLHQIHHEVVNDPTGQYYTEDGDYWAGVNTDEDIEITRTSEDIHKQTPQVFKETLTDTDVFRLLWPHG